MRTKLPADPTASSPKADDSGKLPTLPDGGSGCELTRALGALARGQAGRRVTRAAEGERVGALPKPLILEDQVLQRRERATPGLALGLEDGAGEDDLGDLAALGGHQVDGPAAVVLDHGLDDDGLAGRGRLR